MNVKLLNNNFSEFQNQFFLNQWKQLYRKCLWATPFQSSEFVITWFDHYKSIYSPVIIALENDNHDLEGLLILAVSKEDKQLVVAGAHQAEYQCWLALPDCPDDFIINALAALEKEQLATSTLKFKYLPDNVPVQHLLESEQFSKQVELRKHRRPLLRINAEDIEKSFKKKSNKSRFNRMKRLGELEFKKISDVNEFEDVFNQIINYYDLRQGAINNSFPFLDDSNKRDFHLAWLKNHPDLLHITVTTLNDQLVSAHIGVVGHNAIHLAILAYSPFYANHSPGKLHLMQLGRLLSSEDIPCLDLTPGGDPWKERFANDHDEVFELIIFPSEHGKKLENAKNRCLILLKNCLKPLGITPDRLRQFVAKLKRINSSVIINRLKSLTPRTVEMRIYRHSLASLQHSESNGKMKKNRVSDLLKFTPTEPWQDKQSFSLSVLQRLENGEHCYSYTTSDKLLHYGWLIDEQQEAYISEVQQSYQYPPKSAVLYDFYTDPAARGQGLYQDSIKQMLADKSLDDKTEYIYISVESDNAPSRHVIEKLGFKYQESLFYQKFPGAGKKWKKDMSDSTGEN